MMKNSGSLFTRTSITTPMFAILSLVFMAFTAPSHAQNNKAMNCPVVISHDELQSLKSALSKESWDISEAKILRDLLVPVTPETVAWREGLVIRLLGNQPYLLNQIKFEGNPRAFWFQVFYDVVIPSGAIKSTAAREKLASQIEKILSGEIPVGLSEKEKRELRSDRMVQLMKLKVFFKAPFESVDSGKTNEFIIKSLVGSFRVSAGERSYILKKSLGADYEQVSKDLNFTSSAEQFTSELVHTLDGLGMKFHYQNIVDFLITHE